MDFIEMIYKKTLDKHKRARSRTKLIKRKQISYQRCEEESKILMYDNRS